MTKTASEIIMRELIILGFEEIDVEKSLYENGLDSLDITELGMGIEDVMIYDEGIDLFKLDLSHDSDFATQANSMKLCDFITFIDGEIAKHVQQANIIGA